VVDFFGAQTNSPFDGYWQGLSVGANQLNYSLPTNPNEPIPLNGVVSFPLNLVAGFDLGFLLFHYDTQQFEF